MEIWTMSKRKDGTEIINVPQPAWPELAFFDDDRVMHYIVPTITSDNVASYDIGKLDPKLQALAEALVTEAVVDKVKDDPTKTVTVKKSKAKSKPV
jgi:hypothetical protein